MDPSLKTIAQGCFGKVYKVKFGDTWAAMKKVPEWNIKKRDLQRECEVYYKAQHPNVVKLLADPRLEDSKWNIPLEFIFGEDLEKVMFKTGSKILLTPAVKATIITGMCEGLCHLHSKDIVHQDLKPDNIMVEHQTHRAVIIDLGLAKFFRNGLSSAANMGNEAYSAPEVLRSGVRDKRSDVWAMGKIIAELFSKERFEPQDVSASQVQKTLEDNPYCNPVSRMVEVSPSHRATMADVISDIRGAASASQMTIRPKKVSVAQQNDTRGTAMDFAISPLAQPNKKRESLLERFSKPAFSSIDQQMNRLHRNMDPFEQMTSFESFSSPSQFLSSQFPSDPFSIQPFSSIFSQQSGAMFQQHYHEENRAEFREQITIDGKTAVKHAKFENIKRS